jgi:hypothetical protein
LAIESSDPSCVGGSAKASLHRCCGVLLLQPSMDAKHKLAFVAANLEKAIFHRYFERRRT